MDVVLFGATGMVGQGVLRECLLDPDVARVVAVGRTRTGQNHAKLRDIVPPDLFDLSSIDRDLTGFDACFFCLGVASAGMSEEAYTHVTYDLAVGAATMLAQWNPQMTLIYVSGAGADSTERGKVMWARVRGRTENAILSLRFKGVYVLRPAGIQPLHGIRSRTRLYRFFYIVLGPLLPLLKRMLPRFMTTTEQIGRAMLRIAREGATKKILFTEDINFSRTEH
ncbi:MAG: epimerase [Thermoanaerobaculia bacterium]|nr:epimerase [Thermoanaerobaculia bacterium]